MPILWNAARKDFNAGTAWARNSPRTPTIFFALLAMSWPLTAALAQSSSSSRQSPSSQPSSQQTQSQPQDQPATLDPPTPKQDSLAEAARKAKTNKPAPSKGKVYTEDDLSKMKTSGVSVVGAAPEKGARRTQPSNPDGDAGENSEQYWRGQARQILDAIAYTDQQIEAKKEEIKKYGSGGFDVNSGRRDNVAYIIDRTNQLKELENRKLSLEKQLQDLADEGRKSGAPASWFR